jgi:histidinol-phosphate aminotransferase
MPRYVPGARAGRDHVTPTKVSSNENPYGPLPSVRAAIVAGSETINRYPDMFAVDLTTRLAEHCDVASPQIVVGGGSVSVLNHIIQAYCEPGDEVVFAWRSFEAYPILTQISGAAPVAVPLTEDLRHDLAAMSAAVTTRTKVMLVCSPNNPTGPSVRHDEFVALMERVPSDVVVVLDEAYVEFVTESATVDGRSLLTNYPNLVVLRTFSKAYGLAGLRVGYAVGHEDVMAPIRACVTPFSVSSLAQIAALASLDAEHELMTRVATVIEERTRVLAILAADGWTVTESQGNFFWLRTGEETDRVAAGLQAMPQPVLVRPFSNEGMRITVGSPSENDAVIEGLRAWPVKS